MRRATLGVVLLLAACSSSQDDAAAQPTVRHRPVLEPPGTTLIVPTAHARQEPGGRVLWVLPSARALDPAVFGTPRAPERVARAERGAPEPIRTLTDEVPWLTGVPLRDRARARDNSTFTTTRSPTPFGDATVTVDGSLRATFVDRVRWDGTGPDAVDEAQVHATFTDPAGRRYEVRWRKTIAPPVPGWETGGGVVLGERVFGDTGAGTPLLPAVRAEAAAWGLADLLVDRRTVARQHLVEVAVVEPVRDRDGRLARAADLPLERQRTLGEARQAVLTVWPVTFVDGVPTPTPLPIPWLGQDGQPQPWIHVVYGRVLVGEEAEQLPLVAGPEEELPEEEADAPAPATRPG